MCKRDVGIHKKCNRGSERSISKVHLPVDERVLSSIWQLSRVWLNVFNVEVLFCCIVWLFLFVFFFGRGGRMMNLINCRLVYWFTLYFVIVSNCNFWLVFRPLIIFIFLLAVTFFFFALCISRSGFYISTAVVRCEVCL